jgi:probable HAF family extracellular repeat protein
LAIQTYLVTDLGTLGGGTSSAVAINNNNEVAGTSSTAAGGFDAFLLANGILHDLGNLGGSSAATALNSQGDVVGSSYVVATTTTSHPFLFSERHVDRSWHPRGVQYRGRERGE